MPQQQQQQQLASDRKASAQWVWWLEAGARRSHLLPHQLAGLLAKACAVTAAAAAVAAETAALSLPACTRHNYLYTVKPWTTRCVLLLFLFAKFLNLKQSPILWPACWHQLQRTSLIWSIVKKFTKISRGLSARRASNESKRKRREQKSFLNLFGNALKKYLVRTQCTPLATREFFSSSCCCLQDPSLPRSVVVPLENQEAVSRLLLTFDPGSRTKNKRDRRYAETHVLRCVSVALLYTYSHVNKQISARCTLTKE
ncbi:unnamed protein product [Trichogramma brassicae]|uniref:Uncharacterized protein n=1 Tax=Trichogramma brassicae TaxID=86971 RepID=A0A6H5HZR6_9HYME|nr:unnamed protein product [Trichogramma brassicae]